MNFERLSCRHLASSDSNLRSPRPKQRRYMAAMAQAILAVLGPPLAGKSELAKCLAPVGVRFSVRSHFEPLRTMGALLPPLGTMLDDETACEAALCYLDHGGPITVFDGFPGNLAQVHLLHEAISLSRTELLYLWVDVPKAVAAARARSRRVCFTCDGGVDQARPYPECLDLCLTCGSALSRRQDDEQIGFEHRWKAFRERQLPLLEAVTLSKTISGHSFPYVGELASVDDLRDFLDQSCIETCAALNQQRM